jgi:hypothetical protein
LLAAAAEHPAATLHIIALTDDRLLPIPGNIHTHRAVNRLLQD